MLKRIIITGFAVWLLAACGTANDNEGITNDPNITDETDTTNTANTVDETTSTATEEKSTDITNPKVTMEEAINIFRESYPDAEIESIELDTDFGRLRYDIDGFDSTKEYDVKVDATTKEIQVDEVEANREMNQALDFSKIIQPEKAIEKASTKSEVSGLSPTSWSLEFDDGKQKYTIDFKKNTSEIEIKVDAVTGEILEVEVDD